MAFKLHEHHRVYNYVEVVNFGNCINDLKATPSENQIDGQQKNLLDHRGLGIDPAPFAVSTEHRREQSL